MENEEKMEAKWNTKENKTRIFGEKMLEGCHPEISSYTNMVLAIAYS